MYSCQGLTILIILFSKVILVKSMQCYVCNSLEDETCATKPKVIASCPQLSTGCTKITSKDFRYYHTFQKDEEQNEITWDGENLNWRIIPKPLHIVVRKCYSTYNRFKKQKGCRDISYVSSNITVCVCQHNLCNGTLLNVNLDLAILVPVLLLQFYTLNQ